VPIGAERQEAVEVLRDGEVVERRVGGHEEAGAAVNAAVLLDARRKLVIGQSSLGAGGARQAAQSDPKGRQDPNGRNGRCEPGGGVQRAPGHAA